MKTINCHYTSIKQLTSFLKREDIQDNSALFIQVFAGFSTEKSIKTFQRELSPIFKHATLIGVTSDGNIMDGIIPKLGQTTIAFTQFSKTTLTSGFVSHVKDDFKTGQTLGLTISQQTTRAIIAFSDGLKTNGEKFLHGLSNAVPNTPIAGGMAGDRGELQQTFVFTLTQITSHGGVAVALNGSSLSVHTHYNFGWQPIGKQMQITEADANIVYKIDHYPTQDIYKKYFGVNQKRGNPKQKEENEIDFSLFEFPLVKYESGEYLARAAIACLPNGAVTFAGNLHKGDTVRFAIGDKEKIIEDAQNSLKKLANIPVESVFIYSCTARRRLLGSESGSEIEVFKGRLNVSGFYTYGEFFYHQAHHKENLLNHSMTVIALSETPDSYINTIGSSYITSKKESPSAAIKQQDDKHYSGSYLNSLVAISNFAVNISKDFESLNSKLEDEVKKKSKALLRKTLIDDLTQLPGRLSLLQELNHCHNEILIIVNINDFSKINGFYGLDAGDELLAQVAINLKKFLAVNKEGLEQSKLYKLPSDEYAILTKSMDFKSLELAMRALNKQVFSHSYQILGFDILVQATWAFSPCEGSAKTLIQAELIAKKARSKKQNFVHYSAENFKNSKHKIQLAHKVREAILKNRVYPVFQPIYDNKTGKLIKYECLARLKEMDGTVIPPLVFIKVAQMIQMYPIVTEIMIHKSFRMFQETELCFSVNLSLEDVLSTSTQNMIFEAIQCYGVANQVTFEILETQSLENDSAITQFVSRVKALGAKIAIDDFGSGYANFQHLAKLQADYIKIDGSLIKILGQDPVALSVVESMILFAKNLNIKVIAEFVCSREIYELVKSEGIDYSQGFYLSEPLNELPSIS